MEVQQRMLGFWDEGWGMGKRNWEERRNGRAEWGDWSLCTEFNSIIPSLLPMLFKDPAQASWL